MGPNVDLKPGTDLEASRLSDPLRDCLLPVSIIVDAEGKPRLTTEAARILSQSDPGGEVDHSKPLPESLQNLVREAARSGKPITGRDLSLPFWQGKGKSLRVSAWPIPGGTPPLVLLTLQDCGSLEFLRQPLLQIDRLSHVGMLAASTAHEIKNALVPCKTFLDLLLEQKPGFELAEMVRREIKRMEELLSGLLRISSPGSRSSGTVHLHQVLEDSVCLLQPQFTRRSITITRDFKAPADVLQGNDKHLQQAFMNLLLNALDAVSEHGAITVNTVMISPDGTRGRELRVAIKDNGVGIPPENLARLFQPFFTTKPEGTGLGLCIVHKIVNEHRGTVSVESTPGEGSVFTVCLPV